MKKLILALVAACCTAGMLRAQEVVPADTLKAQPVVATVESQPVVEEKADQSQWDLAELRSLIKEKVSKYVYRETGKKPVILTVIIEI